MIISFIHKGLERFFKTGSIAGIQTKHAGKLRLILEHLNTAKTIEIPCDGVMYNPPHPAEALRFLYIEPLGLTIKQVAERVGVGSGIVSRLLNGHTGITAEMAVRLGKAFNTTADLWLNKQRNYDLWHAKQRIFSRLLFLQFLRAYESTNKL